MPLMSFAKTLRQLAEGSKTVTRRDGWRKLKAGDVVTPVEWSPRVGARWFCEICMETGPTTQPVEEWDDDADDWTQPSQDAVLRHAKRLAEWMTQHSHGPRPEGSWSFRKPRYLPRIRVMSARRERLGQIYVEEVVREGFPGMSPAEFIALYCAPKKPDPDRLVTRIEFERIEP